MTPLVGVPIGTADGINDSGQIVGSDALLHYDMAFLYSAGTESLLDQSLGGHGSVAAGINSNGAIVGTANSSGFQEFAYVYSGGAVTNLGSLLPYFKTGASAINSEGAVVGYGYNLNQLDQMRAFLYSEGSMHVLGTLGGSSSQAVALNDIGQVVGASVTASGESHAFVYSNGIMDDLGTLGNSYVQSEAFAVNNSGSIVGESQDNTGAVQHAFLFSSAIMTDLNTVIAPDSGWTLTDATGINDSGEIIGRGENPSGAFDAYLLTPITVPEPPAFALTAVTIIGLVFCAEHRPLPLVSLIPAWDCESRTSLSFPDSLA